MIQEPVDAQPLCDLCGAPVPDDAWLTVEVDRARPAESSVVGFDYLNAIFCSQEHASQWLAGPLPAPEPVALLTPSRGDRVFDALLVPGIVLVIALALVGLWTVVRWIVTLF
ncbi:hypothetical protein [Actinotalea sp. K2]|uniref:hypothetical protein n=1 Tax=Actinotalea sp. K2 TaxID=2939438 RepID=UPI002017B8C1|nr:hypothetical protein [Actinotalea sp. K2]MCL3861679.1 hypothetical protein [Actinotalea sp. K2]